MKVSNMNSIKQCCTEPTEAPSIYKFSVPHNKKAILFGQGFQGSEYENLTICLYRVDRDSCSKCGTCSMNYQKITIAGCPTCLSCENTEVHDILPGNYVLFASHDGAEDCIDLDADVCPLYFNHIYYDYSK